MTCLNKLLATDDEATFALSEQNMEAFLRFLQAALESPATDRKTRLTLLFLLREIVAKTSGTGSGTFAATVLCLSLGVVETLLALDVEEASSGDRFARSASASTTAAAGSDNLKLQQQNTLETLFSTVFQQNQVAYLLYGDCGYMHVSAVCSVLCCALCQNDPSSSLFWKTLLHLLVDETWVAYFGCPYLLTLLAELMIPSAELPTPRSPSAVSLVSSELLLMLASGVTAGTLALVEDQVHVAGEGSECSH